MKAIPWARGEGRALALSFGYFALLLASYYLIRPLRDAAAAASGADTIRYLASVVFVVMLLIVPAFGWLIARIPRARLLPWLYLFFAANLAAFGVLFQSAPEAPWSGRVFYVWTTVFNMFVVSVFWSFMADVWREQQARRLFGVIAAGGSLGGLIGPWLAHALVARIGAAGIAWLAALLLIACVPAIRALTRGVEADRAAAVVRLDEPLGGAILAGLTGLAKSPFLLGVAALVALGALLGMFVYIELARYAAAAYAGAAARTEFFAARDLWVNAASALLQLLVVGRLSSRFGVRATLTGTALIATGVFVGLGLAPALAGLAAASVVLRTTELGLAKPSRDMLYTVIDAENRYKTKNLIDTVVYRGADATSGWVHAGLVAAGATLTTLAGISVALGLALALIAWSVGSGYRRRGGG